MYVLESLSGSGLYAVVLLILRKVWGGACPFYISLTVLCPEEHHLVPDLPDGGHGEQETEEGEQGGCDNQDLGPLVTQEDKVKQEVWETPA